MKRKKKGFTLLELIIVIIIIGILATIAIPRFLDTVETSRVGSAKTTLDIVWKACLGYRAKFGVYPTADDWNNTIIGGELDMNLDAFNISIDQSGGVTASSNNANKPWQLTKTWNGTFNITPEYERYL